MENLFSIGDFVVSFPLWIIGIFDGETILRSPSGTHPDGGHGPVIFTDRPQAEDFLAQRGGPDGVQFRAVMRPARLLELLDFFESQGMTDVVFDPGKGTKATSVTIAALRVHAAGWAAD